jgi:hypothetical protein
MDGDWSDDVVLKNVFPSGVLSSPKALLISPGQTVEKGESVLNSQMALYILPRIAALLASEQSPECRALGEEMEAVLKTLIPRLTAGTKKQWQEDHGFYARAVLRDWFGGKQVLHKDRLDLEGQVWAFISEFDDPVRLETLKKTIYEKCDAPSPIGAVLASNQIWPAVSQMLTWGYTHIDSELAWRSFVKHTFATKAEIYGRRWLNIWTGPDGINGPCTVDPGGTYETPPVTPMTDFPAMNNNQHAMALLALLRVCGIEPTKAGDGLRITPKIPERYTLDLPLIKLEVTPNRIAGVYCAHNAGTRNLYIRLPSGASSVQVTVSGQSQVAAPGEDGCVQVTLPAFKAGDEIPFEVSAS